MYLVEGHHKKTFWHDSTSPEWNIFKLIITFRKCTKIIHLIVISFKPAL